MSEFAERLRRLRRETPRAAPDAEQAGVVEPAAPAADGPREETPPRPPDPLERAAAGELPSWLKRRIGRAAPASKPALGATLGQPARLVSEGGHRARLDGVAADASHGNLRLDAALAAEPGLLARLARDPALEALDPRRALYLDIETTGLSGGAGTYPFMVALGGFEPDAAGRLEFRVWQGFMDGPADERSMLSAAAERIAAAGSIVTFFGKSFDRHRLEDKMRLFGVKPPFAGLPHLDLYHPLRRLYSEALPDCRLQTHERAVLGFVREDDLSGAFAPAAWFDYQAQRPHLLEHVFRHNYLDVLSLAALTGHLGAAEGRPPCALEPERLEFVRLAALARLAGEERARDAQLDWIERARAALPAACEDLARRAALDAGLELARADALRLARRLEPAREAYLALAERECAWGGIAAVELARLELRRRVHGDVQAVESWAEAARQALARADSGRDPGSDPGRDRARLARGLAELDAQLARRAARDRDAVDEPGRAS